MNIALAIFRYFPYGGLQRDFFRIALEALRRGHEVTVFTSRFDGECPAGLKIVRIPLPARSNHGRAAEFERKFQNLSAPFDLRVGFNRMAGIDFYFAADNCLKKDALDKYPGWFLALSPRYRTFLRQESAIFDPASKTKIFYIVERQKEDYRHFYRTQAERFIYLPPGLNESCFRSADAENRREAKRAELGLKPEQTLLLLIGSVFEGKGVDRLLKAAASLPEEKRARCKIAVVGAVKETQCRKFAAKQKLPESTLLLPGAVADVPEWILAADLMVHPARKEAAGSVIIEAIAGGVPVIASGECGFASFAAESGGTELAAPFRQEELNFALCASLDPEKLHALKRAAAAYGAQADFRRRASCAVDALERYHD